jgi:hypothetical protein
MVRNAMLARRFKARLETQDEGFFIRVPFDVKAAFGRARPPIVVRIGEYSYRSTVSVYGGKYFVPLRRSHREAAGVAAGDLLDVTLTLDEAPRVVEPPPELAAAVARSKKVRAAWEALSYSHQREHADYIVQAKRPDTRARRVQKTLAMLTGD